MKQILEDTNIIKHKVLQLFEENGDFSTNPSFVASIWFDHFQKCFSLQNTRIQWKVLSSTDNEVAEMYPTEFKKIIEHNRYTAHKLIKRYYRSLWKTFPKEHLFQKSKNYQLMEMKCQILLIK